MSEEKKKGPSLADFAEKELKKTGVDVEDGSYPGTLFGYGEPFEIAVSEQFKKADGPTHRWVFDMRFGIRIKDGTVVEVTRMVPVPLDGEANVRSNLTKSLKSMANGDVKLIDKDGNFGKGVKLTTFIGLGAMIGVVKNKKGFPQVDSVSLPADGLKYPTLEECKALQGSDGVPF